MSNKTYACREYVNSKIHSIFYQHCLRSLKWNSTMFRKKTRIKLAARIELGPSKVDVRKEDNSSHYMVDKLITQGHKIICKTGGTGSWTQGLSDCSRLLYHWAIPPRWSQSTDCGDQINALNNKCFTHEHVSFKSKQPIIPLIPVQTTLHNWRQRPVTGIIKAKTWNIYLSEGTHAERCQELFFP